MRKKPDRPVEPLDGLSVPAETGVGGADPEQQRVAARMVLQHGLQFPDHRRPIAALGPRQPFVHGIIDLLRDFREKMPARQWSGMFHHLTHPGLLVIHTIPA